MNTDTITESGLPRPSKDPLSHSEALNTIQSPLIFILVSQDSRIHWPRLLLLWSIFSCAVYLLDYRVKEPAKAYDLEPGCVGKYNTSNPLMHKTNNHSTKQTQILDLYCAASVDNDLF